jgi:hypothetical protein
MLCSCDVEKDMIHTCCDEEADAELKAEDVLDDFNTVVGRVGTVETRVDLMNFCLDVCCAEFNKINPPRARAIKKLASELLLEFLQTVDPEDYLEYEEE